MPAAARHDPAAARGGSGFEAELLELIRARSFKRGEFILTSGRVSDLYFNLKPAMMDPRGAHLCARAFLSQLEGLDAALVGGLEMGAVPVIAALAAISDVEGRPVRTFFVRKQAKGHGTREVIEGLAPGESLQDQRVVVADDVATSGGSLVQAVEVARAAGAVVTDAIVLIDREEGASERLAALGVALHPVFTGADFR